MAETWGAAVFGLIAELLVGFEGQFGAKDAVAEQRDVIDADALSAIEVDVIAPGNVDEVAADGLIQADECAAIVADAAIAADDAQSDYLSEICDFRTLHPKNQAA